MQFSTSMEYAIHGLVYMAKTGGEKAVLLSDIAEAIKVPESYLRKVFQQLVKSRIVQSQRGAQGGYYLGRNAADITLKEVVEAIEGSLPLYTCLNTKRHCGLALDCLVRKAFDEAREKMGEVLSKTSVQDIAAHIADHPGETAWMKVYA